MAVHGDPDQSPLGKKEKKRKKEKTKGASISDVFFWGSSQEQWDVLEHDMMMASIRVDDGAHESVPMRRHVAKVVYGHRMLYYSII